MHAATPMICTDLVEVSRIVSHYAIGTILPELTVENLTAAIQDLQNNPEKLATMKANCSAAAVHENWEMETNVLEKIYPNCGN
jgi:glycosyltransferase involved in cell wall biosynthesis